MTQTSTKQGTSLYQALCDDLRVIGVEHPSRARIVWCFFSSASFLAVFLFRIGGACYGRGLLGKIAEKVIRRINHLLIACDISSSATAGPGLHLPHPVGIVVGRAVIGDHVTIFQNVSLGIRHSSENPLIDAYPTIGNNVKIFAGAVLLGDVKIGNNVLIGANAVVLTDIPDNSTAVGVPARVLPRG